jgi:hypothetical protein
MIPDQAPLDSHDLKRTLTEGGRYRWLIETRESKLTLMDAHELGFTAFLSGPVQRRMRTLFELGQKRRKDVRALLDHSVSFDSRYSTHLFGVGTSSAVIERLLRKQWCWGCVLYHFR